MKHVFWLDPGRIGGRPGPTLEEWSPQELLSSGIGAVLNVSEHEFPTADLRKIGIEVAWIPMPRTVPPEEQDEADCIEALTNVTVFIEHQLTQDRPILVHCVRGCDRTGLVLAYHLGLRERLAPTEAVARVRLVRPEAITADGWEAMANRVLARLLDKTDT